MHSMALIAIIVLSTTLSSSGVVQGSPADEVRSLQAEFYRWRQQDSPEFTTETGVHTYDNKLLDLSTSALDTRKAQVDSFLSRLHAMNPSDLDRQEMYSYEVFNDTLSVFSTNYQWRHYGPLNPLSFLEGDYIDPSFNIDNMKFDTAQDYEKYLSRLNQYPTKQYISRFKMAVSLGHTDHQVSVERIPRQIDDVLKVDPKQSAYYTPFNTDLDKLQLSSAEKNALRMRGHQGVVNLQKAYIDLKRYIQQEFLFKTRQSYGLIGLPQGLDNYRACLKWHTSLDMSPEEVHQKGLEEVARISARIQKIMDKRSFTGTLAEFYKQLKEQPQFHKNTAGELLAEYRNMIYNRIYPQLPRAFKNIPNMNVSVEAMPSDGPGGMYVTGTADGSRLGVFQVNLKRPNETNTFSMMALTLHETVPGHHLQAIYAMTAGLPDFQKNIEYEQYYAVPYHFPFYTAYTEGWALYAESLGEYLNIYKDDNELLGRLGEEIFRGCRLVVDTGLHYFGWTRDRAIQYFVDHTPSARSEIEIEIDRYISWPGQACAYKIGELKIRALRETAMKRLGSKFDIKDFHSQILDNGPVPLNLLEKIVNDWIDSVLGGTPSGNITPTSNLVQLPLFPSLVG